MKKLYPFLKNYKLQAVGAPLFKMTEAFLELFVPLVIANIIDVGIAEKNNAYVIKMCAVLGALALCGLLLAVIAQFFSAKAAVGFAKELRSALFSHILSLGYPEQDSLGQSALVTRMTSDIDRVQNGINLTLRLLLRSPFAVVGAVIMAFTVDAKSAVVFAVAVPVLAIVVFGIMAGSLPLYTKVQQKLDSVVTAVRESLSGVRVIRAFGREGTEKKEFDKKSDMLFLSQRSAGRISALLNPLGFVIINLAVIVLIYTGAIQVNSSRLTRGEVVALYNYMAQILVELIKLADLIISISKAAVSAKRISAVLNVRPSQVFPKKGAVPDYSKPAVEFINVSAKYGGAAEDALTNISFTANGGSSTGVIGLTGSGKTTLINLIPRFYDKSAGELLIFGNPVESYTREQLNSLVSVVPQKAVLFRGTIKQNLLWGNSEASNEDINEAIKVSQSAELVQYKKNGLDEYIEQNGKNLSGGQQQRLCIARALLKKSPILILDDSSSALDAATDAALRRELCELKHRPAIIIVSQRCVSVAGCDNILVLEDGALCAAGNIQQLLESSAQFKEIYASANGGESDV